MIDPRRSANRFRLAVILTLGAALTLGSFWVLEVMRKSIVDSTPDLPRDEPDYYIEKFNFVRMSQTGEAQYNISGLKLTHNPTDDSHFIELPVIKSFSNKSPPMTSHAKHAIVDRNTRKIHMYNNVHIDRPATATSEHFHLVSEYLLILPDEDVMQTDKPVNITLGASKLLGTGMYTNNATRELKLSANVHATYQPASSAVAR